MPLAMGPLILYHDTVREVLQDQLLSLHGTCTLLICSTKRQFLAQLIPIISPHQPVQTAASEEHGEIGGTYESIRPHPILEATLQLISISKRIRFVFCSTIDTLRAYLATVAPPDPLSLHPQRTLLILDLILLHHATSEFSVQGLMRSLSSAVELAARNNIRLQLCECKDVHDFQNSNRGPGLWDAQVPLISRPEKLRGEEAGWGERTVSVRSIAGRWFDFEEGRARGGEADEGKEKRL